MKRERDESTRSALNESSRFYLVRLGVRVTRPDPSITRLEWLAIPLPSVGGELELLGDSQAFGFRGVEGCGGVDLDLPQLLLRLLIDKTALSYYLGQ